MSGRLGQLLFLRVLLILTILGMLVPQLQVASSQQTAQIITIEPPLVYGGHTYTVEYQATGNYRRGDANLFYVATPNFFRAKGITSLTVYRDGTPVRGDEELRTVFTLYTAAYLLYERPPQGNLGSIPPGFRDDLHRVTKNPLFLEQWVTGLIPNRKGQTLEALRALLTPQRNEDDVNHLMEGTRRGIEQGKTFVDAFNDTLEAAKFSNNGAVRNVSKGIQNIFKGWRPVTEQSTVYVEIGGGHRLVMANALDILALSIKLLWLANLSNDRTEWLNTYRASFPSGEAALDNDQSAAADLAMRENQNVWAQRADLILSFAKETAVDSSLKLATDEIAHRWVKWSWKMFGKRTTGHLWAGAAAATSLGLTLGNLLYGLDDLYDNFRIAERADELRVQYQKGRLLLQKNASGQGKTTYDGEMAKSFQAAYMLEVLAAVQAQRSYADGVAATVRDNLLWKVLNPINWFRGTEWRNAVKELRDLADRDEQDAEETIGHPSYLDTALALVQEASPTPPGIVTPVVSTNVLVFDVSGSMDWSDPTGKRKIDAAKEAARALTRMIDRENAVQGAQHQIGLVTFSDSASVRQSPTTNVSALNRTINSLAPDNGTNMAAGIIQGVEQLRGAPAGNKTIMILLSDGVPTVDLNGNQGSDLQTLEAEVMDKAVSRAKGVVDCIYVVGFGDPSQTVQGSPSIDEAFLRRIASALPCGRYYNAKDAQQLQNVYIELRHRSTGKVKGDFTGQIAQNETKQIGKVTVPPNQQELRITLNWPGSALDLILTDPAGRRVDENYPGAHLFTDARPIYYIIEKPKAGTWQVSVYGRDVPEGTTDYNAVLSVVGAPTPQSAGTVVTVPPPTAIPLPSTSPPTSRNAGLVLLLAVVLLVALGAAWLIYQNSTGGGGRAGVIIEDRPDPFVRLRGGSLTIGRGPHNTLVVSDPKVSAQHAMIRRHGDNYVLYDLNSTNGTFVNDQKVKQKPLHHGDQIRVGQTHLRFYS